MLKALNILALAIILSGCQVIPCHREFNRAHAYPGLCMDKAEHYAINLWAAGYNPRIVIVDHGKTELHAVVATEEYPYSYFDPTALRVWSARTVGDIKMIHPPYNPDKEPHETPTTATDPVLAR